MSKLKSNEKIAVLGIDLAKNSFQLHGVDKRGKTVLRKRLNRSRLNEFIANVPPCVIAMEACSGAHHWARTFKSFGHTPKLMAPKFVKPFVKSNKNDAADAEAICEAAQRPNMRFVPIKSIEQQDLQSLHRMRESFVRRRTAQSNQIRGFLLEYGICIAQGIHNVRAQLPLILEDAENGLSGLFRESLHEQQRELLHLDESIEQLESKLKALAKQSDDVKRLMTIPGVGILTATALVASVGDIKVFKNARELSAWLGLVPKQHSTGGKSTLLGISKRGDSYLRKLLIHGARAAMKVAHRYDDRRNQWATELKERRGYNRSTVALANKMARTVWAILINQTTYQATQSVGDSGVRA